MLEILSNSDMREVDLDGRGLSRIGGLRLGRLAAAFACIVPDRGLLDYGSFKTPNCGAGQQCAPLFLDFEPSFADAFAQKSSGTELVITRTHYSCVHRRPQMMRII